jgi:hypothetical protein
MLQLVPKEIHRGSVLFFNRMVRKNSHSFSGKPIFSKKILVSDARPVMVSNDFRQKILAASRTISLYAVDYEPSRKGRKKKNRRNTIFIE